jgi:hypothetical protein
MKNLNRWKCALAVLGSLSLAIVPLEAKPDKGGKGGNGKGGKPAKKEQKGNPGGGAGKKPDHAEKKQQGKPDHAGNPQGKPEFVPFKDDQRKQISDYFSDYQQKHKALPPGLDMNQRRGKPLPPGWEKKLAPGTRLDDDQWSNLAPVPNDWFPGLQMEPDTRLYHYGDRVVRVRDSKREILDVILLNLLR